MKKLSEVVNVVPVIAKSDSLTAEERDLFKIKVHSMCWTSGNGTRLTYHMVQIRDEMVYNNIRLYPFDTDEYDDEEIHLNETIRVRAIVLSLGPHKN
jgi:septin family protein